MPLYSLPIVFVVMLLKEAGVPLPIPSDIVMLGVAARAATGQESVLAVIITLEAAMLLGGTAQYLLARGPGQGLLRRFGPYIGLTLPRLERATYTLRKGGHLTVALGMTTPGLRAVTIAAAGLANLAFVPFFVGLVAGDTLFILAHVLIGYAGGAGLKALAQSQHFATGPVLLLAVVALLVVGLVGWMLLRRRAAPQARPAVAATIQAWEEASCPLCLTLGALHARHEAEQVDIPASPVTGLE